MTSNLSQPTTSTEAAPIASIPDSIHAGDQPVRQLGDWLVTIGAEATSLPGRVPDVHWQDVGRLDDWQWMMTAPSEEWQGSPVLPVQTGDWTAWLIGELFGAPNPAQLVIDVLEEKIPADRLNGHFLLVAAHDRAGELHIWTDRHATLHAYMALNGRRAAVGTFLPAVAAGRGELDWEAITSFFGFGYFAADRTHFEGVRILRPATHYCLDGRGRLIGEQRYWQWHHAPDDARSYDETLEEFAALFATVMGEMTAAGRIAMPISGGLDSRSAVATIAAGRSDVDRFWAYSYGYGHDSVENRIAAKVASARALPYTPFVIQPYLFQRLAHIISSIEGFQDVTKARQAAITSDIRRHADRVIAAHWGDVYLDDMGLAAYPPGSLNHDQLVDKTLVKFRKPYGELLNLLSRPHLSAREPEDVLRSFVSDEMNKLQHIAEPDFLIKAFKTEQWSARWTTASIRAFQAAAFPRLPFYDTRLTDFFSTVPTAFVAGRRLQIDYLKRYAPDLAAVAWQQTGSKLSRAGRPDPLALVRRAINKGRRRVSGRTVIEGNWEVQFLNPEGRLCLEHWLLRPGLSIFEFVSPRRLAGLVDEFYASPHTDKRSYPIAMLLTFSAWLELHSGRSESIS